MPVQSFYMDAWSAVSPPPHGGCAISIHWCGDLDRSQIIISLCVCMYVVVKIHSFSVAWST